PGNQLNRPDIDALGFHVDQDETDALLLSALIGSNKAEAPIGVPASGRPDLLAIDEIVISLVFRFGSERREIRAGSRLRVTLTPSHLSTRYARQVNELLLFAAVFKQGRA